MPKQRSLLFTYLPSSAFFVFFLLFTATSLEAKPKYKTTKSGLKYLITSKVKKGIAVQPLHTVQILFTQTLEDGTPIASSVDPNNPLEFIYGNGEVLKGWEEAVSLMKIGEKGSFIIPPSLAYGEKKAGKIPAKSTIKIDIELIGAYQTFYNPNRTDFTSTASGLKYLIHNKKRSDEAVKAGNYVVLHYTGYIIGADGKKKVFDTSRKATEGNTIQCGARKLVKGLDEGIMNANVGDSLTVIIPPILGYGSKQLKLVPPNSTLGFDVFIERQINPFVEEPKEMIRKEGYSYGFIEKRSQVNAKLNDNVKLNLIGYYKLSDGTPYIFESTIEKKEPQIFRIGKSIENPAWLYVLQQCGKGDIVKLILDPEMARTELKKIIPENVTVFFEFEVVDILAPSFLPVEDILPLELGEGLKMSILKNGSGEVIDTSDFALIHYTGFTIDSLGNKKVFDSSFDRGKPFELQVGKGKVIKGWDKGLVGRKEGDIFRLIIPSELGYGKKGVPPLIFPDETLYFDMFIVKSLKQELIEQNKG